MLVNELFLAFMICLVFCHGNLDKNINTRIKRLHEVVNQSNVEGNSDSTNNDESKLSTQTSVIDKAESINLRLDGIKGPILQNIPKLSNVKNILPSTIPLPVQLILMDNNKQKQRSTDLNPKTNNELKSNDKEIINISNENNADSSVTPTIKHRPIKKKISKNSSKNIEHDNNNTKEENEDISARPQDIENIMKNIKPHSLVLENKLDNTNIDSEKIISPLNYNKEHLFDEAIIPLLNILGKSLKLNDLDTNSVDDKREQKTSLKDVPQFKPENSISNNLDSSKDLQESDVMANEKVTKILEEQNNLLKHILFKTLKYNNEAIKDKDVKEAKKIHVILDINNSDVKENDNSANTITKQNNFENLLKTIVFRNQNYTLQGDNKNLDVNDKPHVKDFRNHLTNPYVYFNDRNIRTYIYSASGNRNQSMLNNLTSHIHDTKRYPITEVDWKRSNNIKSNRKSNNIRIIYIPEEKRIHIPSIHDYESNKYVLKRPQLKQILLSGIDPKLISRCPYHPSYYIS